MPCGEGADLYATEFLSADKALMRLTATFGYLGAAADSATARRHWLRVEGKELLVGFITAVSHPFCDACDRLRLDCHGQIFSCLRSLAWGRFAGAVAQWPNRQGAATDSPGTGGEVCTRGSMAATHHGCNWRLKENG